ncbi:AMP-binding protein [Amycolatopsis alkalitolerans]|uniref:Long-chain fatty acid--CoA ligase n=1 Tax=Amycolatopsis alkalitolerans TaxID=2547244 RepID=A0A5C4LTP4_9PSEU|nr:AMP-binding protein [Amycolatopsis alkalitolerans]TNC20686.1 long-chain fatty acid--CoA ligase [Amycolatopsis alkalitolerans]
MGDSSLFLTRILDVLCEGGDKIAFAHRSRSMSYQETFDTLRRLHTTLKNEGISPGETVAITGGNMPETILLQIAAQLRGARVLHRADLSCEDDDVEADHVLSSDPDCPLLVEGRGTKAAEGDIVMPRAVETVFPAEDGNTVRYSGEYEELARMVEPNPDGPQRVLLIAPMSHPIGNRITLKALLGGDTVVLHERAPETVSSTTLP